MKHNFSRDAFLWGAATSSHQIDGANSASDWWEWEAQGRVEGGVASGLACDHWNRFEADLKLARDLGLNAYRFSIEWARLEPEEGKWDERAIEWYRGLIDACERQGLKPMATLHHFTLPRWFAHEGGFSSENAVAKFTAYVAKVASAFGARIPLWCTLNEPVVLVIGSYLGRFMPPATYSPARASLAFQNLLKCNAAAYDLLHARLGKRAGPWAADKLMVGYAHNMLHFRPTRKFHPLERLIANRLDRVYNLAWLEATTGRAQKFSLPGLIPRAPAVKDLLGKAKADFIGINYYTKAYVEWRPRTKDPNQIGKIPIGISFARRKEDVSDLDWAIYADGLGRCVRRVAHYGLPIFITENGMADRDDSRRPAYILDHLKSLAREIESGADVRGYFHWSLLDNFEWIKGFWPRFGLYQVDYTTLTRTATGSAKLYREIIDAHEKRHPDAAVLERFGR